MADDRSDLGNRIIIVKVLYLPDGYLSIRTDMDRGMGNSNKTDDEWDQRRAFISTQCDTKLHSCIPHYPLIYTLMVPASDWMVQLDVLIVSW